MKRTENEAKRYQTFEDLEVYQVAREFRKMMYRVARRLPKEERFALASQIRRTAVSLTNNIAEGHGRFHFLEQIKFMLQARGSLDELLDDLNVCTDETYLPEDEIQKFEVRGMARSQTYQWLHSVLAWPCGRRSLPRPRSFFR
jgi:four helix bundle protein